VVVVVYVTAEVVAIMLEVLIAELVVELPKDAYDLEDEELLEVAEQRRALVLDTSRGGRSIPGSIGLWGAGIGGSILAGAIRTLRSPTICSSS
jgi:hypothetical protein